MEGFIVLLLLQLNIATDVARATSCSAVTCSACVADSSCGWFSCSGAEASCDAKATSKSCDKLQCHTPSPPPSPSPSFAMGCNHPPQSKMAFCNTSLPRSDRVDDFIGRLTANERLALLRAANPKIPRLGLGSY
eukprot:gene5842-9463_t